MDNENLRLQCLQIASGKISLARECYEFVRGMDGSFAKKSPKETAAISPKRKIKRAA